MSGPSQSSNFFQKIGQQLGELMQELATTDSAVLQQAPDGKQTVMLFSRTSLDGDTVQFVHEDLKETEMNELIELHNSLQQSAVIAKQGLAQALVELFPIPKL